LKIGFTTSILLVCAAFAPLLPSKTYTQDDIAKYKEHFEKETNPVRRADAITKLGRAEFAVAEENIGSGNVNAALQLVEDYGGQAELAHDGLVKTGVNAEKHSNGFRQLQISVRESLLRLRDIETLLTFEQRPPFEAIRERLDKLNQQLLVELFPRRPGHEPPDEQKKP
jgi:hypothetical protein